MDAHNGLVFGFLHVNRVCKNHPVFHKFMEAILGFEGFTRFMSLPWGMFWNIHFKGL